jgi:TctA family transporter
MLEMSLRQSLAMSSGSYAIFVNRPIAAVMLFIGAALLLLSLRPVFARGADWRQRFGLAEKPS